MTCPVPPEALMDKARLVVAQGLLCEAVAGAPPSPCISVCRMDDDRSHCEGCLRTLDELRQWGKADAAAQRQIWHAVLQRCGFTAATTSHS